jgi:hypothetical protein
MSAQRHEGIRGAEWYNNGPEFTTTAAEHNTIIPFARNVVGPIDYTPVTFTNSQFPHNTSYGHELALSVVNTTKYEKHSFLCNSTFIICS